MRILYLILALSLVTQLVFCQQSTLIETGTIKLESEQEILQLFLRPVRFSKQGFNNFFIDRFNAKIYAERFLPSCFIHLTDFLEYGTKKDQPPSYFESSFKLFHQRLKESTWVNPYALLAFIERLPEFFDFMYIEETMEQNLSEKIRAELETALLEQFDLLKKNPAEFLDQTALTLTNTAVHSEEFQAIASLRSAIINFLESAMNKLIWNPFDKIDVWKSCKLLCQRCEDLYSYGLIDKTQDANQLIWSILYRFGYFIECAGSQMTKEFYETIQKELDDESLTFLEIDEQENLLTTKREYLEQILRNGLIKVHAFDQGIFSETILT